MQQDSLHMRNFGRVRNQHICGCTDPLELELCTFEDPKMLSLSCLKFVNTWLFQDMVWHIFHQD